MRRRGLGGTGCYIPAEDRLAGSPLRWDSMVFLPRLKFHDTRGFAPLIDGDSIFLCTLTRTPGSPIVSSTRSTESFPWLHYLARLRLLKPLVQSPNALTWPLCFLGILNFLPHSLSPNSLSQRWRKMRRRLIKNSTRLSMHASASQHRIKLEAAQIDIKS